MEKAQTIHLGSCLPQSWWEFSVDCAIHIYNHTPIKRQNWMSPFEKLEHTKPDVTHFRVFRCGAYVFLLEDVHTNKLNPKLELITFIGYPQGTKGCTLICTQLCGWCNVVKITAEMLGARSGV